MSIFGDFFNSTSYLSNDVSMSEELAKLGEHCVKGIADGMKSFKTEYETINNIKKVIFNGTKTIILWKDGTKTIVGCKEGDQYDEYAGFCAAVVKKIFGSTSRAKKFLRSEAQK